MRLILAGDTVVGVGRRILPKAEDERTARRCLAPAFRPPSPGVFFGHRPALARRHAARGAERDDRAVQAARTRWRSRPISGLVNGTARRAAMPYRAVPRASARWISGSHSGVVGLPLYETRHLLRAAGMQIA